MDVSRKIKPYLCFGFNQAKKLGDEYVGRCPLCDRKDHFYVNEKTGLFSCKSCSEEGNTYTFLKTYSNLVYESTTTEEYRELAKHRGLPVKALRDWRLGWNGEHWLLPVLSEKKTCRDIRRWNPKDKKNPMKSTAGCKAQLYGWYRASRLDAGSTIYICEGEWDAIALSWLLWRAGVVNVGVVAVPGQNTFKDEWIDDLKPYHIILCYDNDSPGEAGSVKAFHKLKDNPEEIEVLSWPARFPKSYDVRDFIREQIQEKIGPKKILKNLRAYVVEPEELSRYLDEEDQVEKEEDILENPPSFNETLTVYKKWADMSPDLVNALKIMFAVVLSTKMAGDPLWMYIVGPSGSGKTMLLISLRRNPQSVFVSNVTSKSIVSGFKTKPDPSLLPKWNNKTCVWKDFTEILESRDKDEIYSTLRGAFDGQVHRTFGNAVERIYDNLHFSMLAGVTPAVHGDKKAMLGERFLKFEIFKNINEDTTTQIEAAMSDSGKEDLMARELELAAKNFLARKIDLPRLPEWVKKRIIALSQLTSMLTTVIDREQFGNREVSYMPSPQIGTRIAKQLAKLARFIALVMGHKSVQYEDYLLVEDTAFSTSRKMYLLILSTIAKTGGSATIKEIQLRTRLGWYTISSQINDLHLLGIIDQASIEHTKLKGRPSIKWKLTKKMESLFAFVKLGEKLLKARRRKDL